MHVRADAAIDLTQEQRSELERVARLRRTPQAIDGRRKTANSWPTAQGVFVRVGYVEGAHGGDRLKLHGNVGIVSRAETAHLP